MTSANVEVVRRQVDAFNRRDPDAIAADWHPEGIFEPASVAPIEDGRTRVPTGSIDLGARVLALGRIEVRHRDTDVPIAQPHATVYEFREGQIVRLRSYLDHAEARAAADAMQA
jgi:hypothetical protein